jgi:hypothetical protein
VAKQLSMPAMRWVEATGIDYDAVELILSEHDRFAARCPAEYLSKRSSVTVAFRGTCNVVSLRE